jgi:hypothetical protein
MRTVLPRLDTAVRSGDLETAVNIVDPLVLQPLDLEHDEIEALRAAKTWLASRRRKKSAASSKSGVDGA